ncbi:MAG: hypothetical protein Q7U89_06590, partial [Coriobacteriia bacterium]|nr:hypothetical protein [Coriobacteriia bacterium]
MAGRRQRWLILLRIPCGMSLDPLGSLSALVLGIGLPGTHVPGHLTDDRVISAYRPVLVPARQGEYARQSKSALNGSRTTGEMTIVSDGFGLADELAPERARTMMRLYCKKLDELGYSAHPYPNVDAKVGANIYAAGKFEALNHALWMCGQVEGFIRQ